MSKVLIDDDGLSIQRSLTMIMNMTVQLMKNNHGVY